MTLAAVAEASGVSIPTLQRRFGNKDGLFAAVGDRVRARHGPTANAGGQRRRRARRPARALRARGPHGMAPVETGGARPAAASCGGEGAPDAPGVGRAGFQKGAAVAQRRGAQAAGRRARRCDGPVPVEAAAR
ncbi:MAG: TetR/AcrR family transcriptional regulator [Myxococcota bacterium]